MIKTTQEEILEAMGWTITCNSVLEIEHEDGSSASGKAVNPLIDSIIEDYKIMKANEAVAAVFNTKLEATKDLDLNSINGNEIIDFLNSKLKDRYEEEEEEEMYSFIDLSISGFKFDGQKTKDDEYVLDFIGVYNNWGTDQDIDGNSIHIGKNGVRVRVEEPFEGDGSDEVIENVLTKWLKTHTFSSSPQIKYFELVNKAQDKLGDTAFNSPSKMQDVINLLIEAKTYMK